MDGGGGFGGALCRDKVPNNHLQGKAALDLYFGLLGCGMDRLIFLLEQGRSDVLAITLQCHGLQMSSISPAACHEMV
jgi:hypothetical protein